jgi:hypothetical protein
MAGYANGIQIEDICILCLNNSVPRNRFIINGKESVLYETGFERFISILTFMYFAFSTLYASPSGTQVLTHL